MEYRKQILHIKPFKLLTVIVVSFALIACSGSAENTRTSSTKAEIIKTEPQVRIKDRINTDSASKEVILYWLNNHKGSELVLPVIVTFDEYKLGIEKAVVTLNTNTESESEILLNLDDSPMGISLTDKLHQHCRESQRSCLLYLEGIWGPLSGAIEAVGDSVQSKNKTDKRKWPFVVYGINKELMQSESSTNQPYIYEVE